MKRKLFIALFMLSFALITREFISPPRKTHARPQTRSGMTCQPYNIGNWHIPGIITNDTWWIEFPDHISGKSVFYAPYLMEATAYIREMDMDGFIGAISTPSAAMIGEVVWLKRSGLEWEGPYLVVDTSQRNHAYHHVVDVGIISEVDFETAVRWGMATPGENKFHMKKAILDGIEMYRGLEPPPDDSQPVVLSDWYAERVEFCEGYSYNAWWDTEDAKYQTHEDYLVALNNLPIPDAIPEQQVFFVYHNPMMMDYQISLGETENEIPATKMVKAYITGLL